MNLTAELKRVQRPEVFCIFDEKFSFASELFVLDDDDGDVRIRRKGDVGERSGD